MTTNNEHPEVVPKIYVQPKRPLPYLIEAESCIEDETPKKYLTLRNIPSNGWVRDFSDFADHITTKNGQPIQHIVDQVSAHDIALMKKWAPYFLASDAEFLIQVGHPLNTQEWLHVKGVSECDLCRDEFYRFYDNSYICQHAQSKPGFPKSEDEEDADARWDREEEDDELFYQKRNNKRAVVSDEEEDDQEWLLPKRARADRDDLFDEAD